MIAFGQLHGSVAIAQVLQDGSFDRLASMLDALELQVNAPELPIGWPYSAHLLAHIHNWQLEDARFLWRRIPPQLKQNADIDAAYRLLQALWNKDYEGTWQAFGSYAWPQPIEALASATGGILSARILSLLGRAYSVLPLRRAVALLGLTEDAATSLAEASGWTVDVRSGMLSSPASIDRVAMPDYDKHLERLSQYMISVEAEPDIQKQQASGAAVA